MTLLHLPHKLEKDLFFIDLESLILVCVFLEKVSKSENTKEKKKNSKYDPANECPPELALEGTRSFPFLDFEVKRIRVVWLSPLIGPTVTTPTHCLDRWVNFPLFLQVPKHLMREWENERSRWILKCDIIFTLLLVLLHIPKIIPSMNRENRSSSDSRKIQNLQLRLEHPPRRKKRFERAQQDTSNEKK